MLEEAQEKYINWKSIKLNSEFADVSERLIELTELPEGYVVINIDDYIRAKSEFTVKIGGVKYESERKGILNPDYVAKLGTRRYIIDKSKIESKTTMFDIEDYEIVDDEGNIYKSKNRNIKLQRDISDNENKGNELVYSFNFEKSGFIKNVEDPKIIIERDVENLKAILNNAEKTEEYQKDNVLPVLSELEKTLQSAIDENKKGISLTEDDRIMFANLFGDYLKAYEEFPEYVQKKLGDIDGRINSLLPIKN